MEFELPQSLSIKSIKKEYIKEIWINDLDVIKKYIFKNPEYETKYLNYFEYVEHLIPGFKFFKQDNSVVVSSNKISNMPINYNLRLKLLAEYIIDINRLFNEKDKFFFLYDPTIVNVFYNSNKLVLIDESQFAYRTDYNQFITDIIFIFGQAVNSDICCNKTNDVCFETLKQDVFSAINRVLEDVPRK